MILVTGASGYIGSSVVSDLATGGHDVVVMVRGAEAGSRFGAAGIPLRLADYDDRDALLGAFAGVDELVLISSDGHAAAVARHHANAVAAAVATRVKRIVFTSIVDIDPTSPFYFAQVYRETEHKLAASGIPTTVLRCGLYSDFVVQSLLAPARNAGRFCFPAGGGKIAPISRSDVAAAIATVVADKPQYRMFELSGAEALTFDEIAAAFSRVTQCPIRYSSCSVAHYRAWASEEFDDPWPQAFATLGAAIEEGRFSKVSPDFRRLTGRDPEPFSAVLTRTEEHHSRPGHKYSRSSPARRSVASSGTAF